MNNRKPTYEELVRKIQGLERAYLNKPTYEELVRKIQDLERAYRNCYALMTKGDADIKKLKNEVTVLKKRNEALETSATRQADARDSETQRELQELRGQLQLQHGSGQADAILKLRKEIRKKDTTNAQLMSQIDKLSQRLAEAQRK